MLIRNIVFDLAAATTLECGLECRRVLPDTAGLVRWKNHPLEAEASPTLRVCPYVLHCLSVMADSERADAWTAIGDGWYLL
ncbi:MAG: hypothetical protein SVY53_03125 [Chloroflexota bacterium]|nr:hypothetical protein [Chloroflexota bacterium]